MFPLVKQEKTISKNAAASRVVLSIDLFELITPLDGWWLFVCKRVILFTDKSKKKPNRFIDSDDEDDDLDDFIDDEDDDIDYSSAIRDIFGYDKSRYVSLCTYITLCMRDLFMSYTVYEWPIYVLVLYCVWVTYLFTYITLC